MLYRFAEVADCPLLAAMNEQLIQDENHRNSMTVAELERRMAEWLAGPYQAVVLEDESHVYGYALFREEADYLYLRHFYVKREHRRKGIGRAAIEWLCRHGWNENQRVRADVLAGNAAGIAFWKSVSFSEYSVTLEREGNAMPAAPA